MFWGDEDAFLKVDNARLLNSRSPLSKYGLDVEISVRHGRDVAKDIKEMFRAMNTEDLIYIYKNLRFNEFSDTITIDGLKE